MLANAALSRLPLPKDRAQQIATLIDDLDTVSLWWLSGYTAGLASRGAPTAVPEATGTATKAVEAVRLTVLYGSQTGNAKRLAGELAASAEAAGLAVRLVRADAYPQRELAKERLLYVVISTQGDGDAPDDARSLLDFLAQRRAPKLEGLSYAVLGLGDSSYPQFCSIGRKLDARLAELGAQRLVDFGAADLDIETVATPWLAGALDAARAHLKTLTPAQAPTNVTRLRPHAETSAWSAARPFKAEIVASQRLTTTDSAKDVRHIEIDLAGSGLDYEPGDSLGVVPRNPSALVAEVLATLGLDGEAPVRVGETELPLREWLAARRELTRLSRPFVGALAELGGHAGLQALLDPANAEALRQLLDTNQPIDLLQRYPATWSGEALVAALRPLAPRLYSIASSRAVVGEEAHLTVGHVEYATPAGTRWGAASHWLASRAEGDTLEVYIERNERFRLPADDSRDLIMIGPGTGVAPFRAFLQQRAESGASGRHWLFFGNPHFRTDFLYQVEWQAALKDGSLDRLDLAFSRDQEHKIYVQDRVREAGAELFAWLEGGAHLYLCGAITMARDVERALHDVIATHGALSAEDTDAYLARLRDDHRLLRDVY